MQLSVSLGHLCSRAVVLDSVFLLPSCQGAQGQCSCLCLSKVKAYRQSQARSGLHSRSSGAPPGQGLGSASSGMSWRPPRSCLSSKSLQGTVVMVLWNRGRWVMLCPVSWCPLLEPPWAVLLTTHLVLGWSELAPPERALWRPSPGCRVGVGWCCSVASSDLCVKGLYSDLQSELLSCLHALPDLCFVSQQNTPSPKKFPSVCSNLFPNIGGDSEIGKVAFSFITRQGPQRWCWGNLCVHWANKSVCLPGAVFIYLHIISRLRTSFLKL